MAAQYKGKRKPPSTALHSPQHTTALHCTALVFLTIHIA